MVTALLGLALSIPGLFVLQFVFALALYYGLSWLSFHYFFVWRKEHYFPGEPMPDPEEDRRARRIALWNLLGNAALGTPFQYWIFHGHGRIYYSVAERGWAYYAGSAVACLMLTELGVYWAHRCLHHPVLYKRLHLYHHLFRRPTPWVSMAFHPVDSWLQALPTYLCAMFIPMHISLYVGGFLFLTLWTFWIHDRVSFVRLPFVHYTAHHTIHHAYNKYNFGQYLTLFDRVFGTHKDPMKEQRFSVMYPPARAAGEAPQPVVHGAE